MSELYNIVALAGGTAIFTFAFIVACTVYVILEIEYPRLGLVRIDAIEQLLVNARAGMN